MICRMCDKYTIFDHMYITVCTLSYNITSVEYDLVASMLFTKLGSHNVRDQVQSLDVAVQETGILYGHQFQSLGRITDLGRTDHDPQTSFLSFRKYMISRCNGPGYLPVYEQLISVNFFHHLVQDIFYFLFRMRNLDLQQCCTVKKTIHMLIQIEDHMVACTGGIIYTVTIVMRTVIKRNHHFVDFVILSIIVT